MGYYDSVLLMALAETATKSISPSVWNATVIGDDHGLPGRWWCIRT